MWNDIVQGICTECIKRERPSGFPPLLISGHSFHPFGVLVIAEQDALPMNGPLGDVGGQSHRRRAFLKVD